MAIDFPTMFEKLGIPLGFAVIFLIAISILFDNFIDQQEKIYSLTQDQIAANTQVVETVKDSMAKQESRDIKAEALRKRHIDVSESTRSAIEQFTQLVRVNERTMTQRSLYLMHALNQLAKAQGLDEPFPKAILDDVLISPVERIEK